MILKYYILGSTVYLLLVAGWSNRSLLSSVQVEHFETPNDSAHYVSNISTVFLLVQMLSFHFPPRKNMMTRCSSLRFSRLTMLDMFEGEGAKRAPGDLWATQISDENDKILKSWLVNMGVTWLWSNETEDHPRNQGLRAIGWILSAILKMTKYSLDCAPKNPSRCLDGLLVPAVLQIFYIQKCIYNYFRLDLLVLK